MDGAAQHDPVNGVRVPLDVLEAAESSLGRFCSDLGWGDDDMQNMDNLSAYIARYRSVKSRKIITEYKTFTAPRYRDPNGAPTCCADMQSGQFCRFLGARNFGTVPVCMFGQDRQVYRGESGYLEPVASCWIWSDDENGNEASEASEAIETNKERP